MHTFHYELVTRLQQQYGKKISELCLIFPTRRAQVFFREAMAEAYKETIWMPQHFAIEDFMKEQHGGFFPDSVQLVFELYETFKVEMRKKKPDYAETFESFYPWGEILLKDFDEIDKYYVDAQQLYTNLRDLKEVDVAIGMSEEVIESIQKFLKSLNFEDYSKIQQSFLELWEVLYDVYSNFREKLRLRHQAYTGMGYREIVEKIKDGQLYLPYPQVIFIGFNALSKVEELLIDELLRKKQAQIYWDGITHENLKSSDILKEIYGFVSYYHKKWKDKGSFLIETDLNQKPKNIYITGIPQQSGQARYLGELLSKVKWKDEKDMRKYGVILADENLLFPTLYSLPQHTDCLNVTMGFPLRYTSVYHLLMAITRMIRSMRKPDSGNPSLYNKHVSDVLQNPFVKSLAPQTCSDIQFSLSKENRIYVNASFLLGKGLPPFIAQIFTLPQKEEDAISYFQELFEALLEEAEKAKMGLDAEYLYFCYRRFNQLREVLLQYETPSFKAFSTIFRDAMRGLRIPFEGEPLKGLQIMGTLETRTLDFEHLYILGANEGNLPTGASTSNSFIPGELKKGFRIPSEEEKANIIGYHFYRLLQRADNVHIVYNSEVRGAGNAGEMSRYIMQMRTIFTPDKFPNINLFETQISPKAPYFTSSEITMPMTEEVLAKLRQKYDANTSEVGNALSVSSLQAYLTCPLQFYFKYVAEIKPKTEISEEIDEMKFGEMLHLVMEKLYTPYVGTLLSAEIIAELKTKIAATVAEVYTDEGYRLDEELVGKNYLYKGIMEQLCERILDNDLRELPFTIEMVELRNAYKTLLPINNMQIRLDGNLDRLDKLEDGETYRIIDYKTGKTKIKQDIEIAKLFEPQKDIMKAEFQGYFYAYLFNKRPKYASKPVKVGFYALKSSGNAILYLKKDVFIVENDYQTVEFQIKQLVNRIFTEDFPQTAHIEHCKYCTFSGICDKRESEDEV